MRRAAKKIAADNPGKELPDLGFRSYKLTTSNIKPWQSVSDADVLQTQLAAFAESNLVPGRSQDDILAEILLRTGYELTAPVERLTLAGKQVFSVLDDSLLVCAEPVLTIELIEAMVARGPGKIICLESGFQGNDHLKVNAMRTLALAKESARDESGERRELLIDFEVY